MSCTVFALPYALAWVIGSVVVGAIQSRDEVGGLDTDIDLNSLNNIQAPCEDVTVITDKHFIEKSFETAFMDKDTESAEF